MKPTLFIIICSTFLFSARKSNWIIGNWEIDYMITNGDTIFNNKNYNSTLKYFNKISNERKTYWTEKFVDSLAKVKFDELKNVYFIFDKKSFSTSFLSHSNFHPVPMVIGKYYTKEDTMYLEYTGANNQESKFWLQIEPNKKYLYLNKTVGINTSYVQFHKKTK